MPANFGLLPELPERIKEKRKRVGAYRDRAIKDLLKLSNKNIEIFSKTIERSQEELLMHRNHLNSRN